MASDYEALEGMRQTRSLRQEATEAKRVRALELLAEGHPVKTVALAVGRPRNAVARWRREAHGVI